MSVRILWYRSSKRSLSSQLTWRSSYARSVEIARKSTTTTSAYCSMQVLAVILAELAPTFPQTRAHLHSCGSRTSLTIWTRFSSSELKPPSNSENSWIICTCDLFFVTKDWLSINWINKSFLTFKRLGFQRIHSKVNT